MDKSEFIRNASIHLMASAQIVNAIHQGCSLNKLLASEAVTAAEFLWDELEKSGYCKLDNSDDTKEEVSDSERVEIEKGVAKCLIIKYDNNGKLIGITHNPFLSIEEDYIVAEFMSSRLVFDKKSLYQIAFDKDSKMIGLNQNTLLWMRDDFDFNDQRRW